MINLFLDYDHFSHLKLELTVVKDLFCNFDCVKCKVCMVLCFICICNTIFAFWNIL